MRALGLVLLLFVVLTTAHGFFGFGSLLNTFSTIPRCTGCPPRHCVKDIAVVKGYCCGCARVSDVLPIDCPNNNILRCPVDGRQLCKDYDYMLDCCCNFR